MNDTPITVVGNVVTRPERRRIESTGDTVVFFRIASTSRRFDKASGMWVDGNTFFVRVSCWRGLADNAYQSLFKGDPVVVHGRISTREYEADDGVKRSFQELEASAVGHNLSRGTSVFQRGKPAHLSVGAVAELNQEMPGTPTEDADLGVDSEADPQTGRDASPHMDRDTGTAANTASHVTNGVTNEVTTRLTENSTVGSSDPRTADTDLETATEYDYRVLPEPVGAAAG